MSLLIVEDDKEVRLALKRVAERIFSEVVDASCAYDALLIVELQRPDVITLVNIERIQSLF